MTAFKGINWLSLGSAVISGIKNGINNGIESIKEAARNVASSALNAAKSLLGIASPSKVFRDQVGKMISKGLAIGIENENSPIEAVQSTVQNLIDTAKSGVSEIDIPISTSAKTSVMESATSAQNANSKKLKDIYNYMKEEFVFDLSDTISDNLTVEFEGREIGRVVKKYA
jgi:phage-related protein